MAHPNRSHKSGKKLARQHRSSPPVERPIPQITPRKPPTVFGKAFILLEDDQKNTFEYREGAWVSCDWSIAVCRAEGEVKVLPQRINNMTRYQVRLPVSHD